jgi:hypothetical protein
MSIFLVLCALAGLAVAAAVVSIVFHVLRD